MFFFNFRKYGRNSRNDNEKVEQEKIHSQKRFPTGWIVAGMEELEKEKCSF